MGSTGSNTKAIDATQQSTTALHDRGSEAHTRYIKSITAPYATRCFKAGTNNKKIGGPVVTKGKWRGLPIFTLTLEERSTCPPHCEQWNDCYGNNMPFAKRIDHRSPLFYEALTDELDTFDYLYTYGYVVRPHILGDFFDEKYVRWWGAQVLRRPALHGWGFTHHRSDSRIGRYIQEHINCDRFNIRFSDDPTLINSTRVEDDWEYQPADDEIVCPEQLGQTSSCANCSLCWEQRDKRIIFLRH